MVLAVLCMRFNESLQNCAHVLLSNRTGARIHFFDAHAIRDITPIRIVHFCGLFFPLSTLCHQILNGTLIALRKPWIHQIVLVCETECVVRSIMAWKTHCWCWRLGGLSSAIALLS